MVKFSSMFALVKKRVCVASFLCLWDREREGMGVMMSSRGRFDVLLRDFFLYLAAILVPGILASPVDTAAVSHKLALPSDSSPTTITSSANNNNTNATTPRFPNIHCLPSSSYPSFITPSFRPGDCVRAIRHFNDRTAFPQGSETFEFLSRGAVAQFLEPKQRSPQKWWSGTCVVAVVLLSDFEESELPQGTWRDRKTDLADFGMMVGQAMDVDRACLDLRGVPPQAVDGVDVARRGRGGLNFVQDVGFAVIGHFQAMGVFLWDTDSLVNTRIRTVEELAAARVGNETSSSVGAAAVGGSGDVVDELPQTT